jgi:hypothetical protein
MKTENRVIKERSEMRVRQNLNFSTLEHFQNSWPLKKGGGGFKQPPAISRRVKQLGLLRGKI